MLWRQTKNRWEERRLYRGATHVPEGVRGQWLWKQQKAHLPMVIHQPKSQARLPALENGQKNSSNHGVHTGSACREESEEPQIEEYHVNKKWRTDAAAKIMCRLDSSEHQWTTKNSPYC